MIEDTQFRDCLSCALHENQDERSDLKQLFEHAFFDTTENQTTDNAEVKLIGNLDKLVELKNKSY